MEISATVTSSASAHVSTVRTGAVSQALAVPAKATGFGSAVNGGEFLMLALATCYCNDLYREAARLRIPIKGIEVEATAEFPGVGLAATNIRYRAVVKSSANAAAIAQLLRETDAVAEVHNTVRAGIPVELLRQ
jgi:organic hydroperoxide reductase OsmC/OhrA